MKQCQMAEEIAIHVLNWNSMLILTTIGTKTAFNKAILILN